jgi:hypothetical protein
MFPESHRIFPESPNQAHRERDVRRALLHV